MFFTIGVKTLKSILDKLDKFFKGNSDKFKQIKCVCENDCLSLQSRVSEQTILIKYKVADYDIIVEKEGATVIDFERFKSMVYALPEDKRAEIRLNNADVVILSCGKSMFKFATEDPETFRDIKPIEGGVRFKFNADELVSALTLCAKVVEDNIRPPLNGVHICNSDEAGKVDIVGTDTKRMARVKIECVEYPEQKTGKGITISKTSAIVCAGLYKTCYNEEGHIDFTCNDNTCVIDDGQTAYYIGLIESPYPAYKSLYEFDSSWKRFAINRSELLAALKQVSTVVTNEYPGAVFCFTDNGVNIKSSSPEYGEANTTISFDGNIAGKMKFAVKLLQDVFPFDSDMIEIVTPEKLNSKIIINPNGNVVFVVMQLTLHNND